MMPSNIPPSREERLQSAMDAAYSRVCPQMNRAERRTAKGKLLVALGKIAMLEAKLKFLEEEKLQQESGG